MSPEEYRNIEFFGKLRPACVYGWLHVAAIETVVSEIDTFASSTGDFNINILDHMKKLENLLSLRTPDTLTTIDLVGSQGLEGMKVDTVKPQKIVFVFMPGSSRKVQRQRCQPSFTASASVASRSNSVVRTFLSLYRAFPLDTCAITRD